MENDEMNTTFMINGGAGRVVSAIPALEKFARLNPNDDFRVVVYGWELLFWSHPVLQKKTFPAGQKGMFESIIKNNKLICPEPYLNYKYYNQQLSLAEAFDEDINRTEDHSDLAPPKLYISSYERSSIKRIIGELKEQYKKSKVVVFQPYGSGIAVVNGRPFDSSHRSLDVDDYLKMVKMLPKDCLVIYFGDPNFRHPMDDVSVDLTKFNPDLRMYMSFISECDYFVGVDSVGQHIARAFNKPGSVIMGSTFESNVSYPGHFRFLRKEGHEPTYSPIRMPGFDNDFADRLNDGIMAFSQEELEKFVNTISLDIYNE